MGRRHVLIALAACGFIGYSSPAQTGPFEGHRVVRVAPRSASELLAVSSIATSVWSCSVGQGPIDVQVTPAQQAALEQLGLTCVVRVPDVQALVDDESQQIREAHLNRDAAWFTTYRNLAEINAKLDQLAAVSGGLATTFIVGNTLEGRQVRGIRFTGPDRPGNPRNARPAALFAGGIHAREWISPMTAMYLADTMLERRETDPRIADLFDHVEIIVIPVQNADGYAFTWASPVNRNWRKNRRNNGNGTFGVDLNRNFGYQWGGPGAGTNPIEETYRGTGPFSEPETQIFRDFVSANPRIRTHVDIHSYGQYLLTPWGYTAAPPPDAALFERLTDEMAAEIRSVHGSTYANGQAYSLLYPAAGASKDWTYGDRNILGMTAELRDTGQFGFLLPASQIIPTAEEWFEAALVLMDAARSPLLLSTPDAELSQLRDGQTANVRLLVRPGTTTLAATAPTLRWRIGAAGAFSSTPMTGGSPWTAPLSGPACSGELEWYFEATGADGSVAKLPAGAPATVFKTTPLGSLTPFFDDMETDRGWSVGATDDDATAGFWQRADPVGTIAQPDNDTTPTGVRCWVTGAADANDIDGGRTTLTSPVIDARPPRGFRVWNTRVQCQLWFSTNTGPNPNADAMLFELSFNAGANWTQAAVVTQSVGNWWTFGVRVEDFQAPTDRMRFRFRPRDASGDSTVEAAVDDFSIVLDGCRTGDFTGDAGIDGDDVIGFFVAWDAGLIQADYTGDGAVDGDDAILFFSLWDSGR
ncbi:MAG: M14 family zinc carboxypeptidase [Phycisphaerales bacterium]